MSIEVIAHRGWLSGPDEDGSFGNSERTLANALSLGLGIEFDIRDGDGSIVVTHDPYRREKVFELESLLQHYKYIGSRSTLAINIKADGLAGQLGILLNRYDISNYFTFDQSGPESVAYLRAGLTLGLRKSEHEELFSFDYEPKWIVLDQFDSDWVNATTIRKYSELSNNIFIISPELHGRDPRSFWSMLKSECVDLPNLRLCTDYYYEFISHTS